MNLLAYIQTEREKGHGLRSLFSVLTILLWFNPVWTSQGLRNGVSGTSVIVKWSRRELGMAGGGGWGGCIRGVIVFFIVKQPSERKATTTNISNQAFRLKIEMRNDAQGAFVKEEIFQKWFLAAATLFSCEISMRDKLLLSFHAWICSVITSQSTSCSHADRAEEKNVIRLLWRHNFNTNRLWCRM